MQPDATLTQARNAQQAGALATAEACYREYLAGRPDDAGALQEFAGVLYAQARLVEAEAALDRALGLRPGNAGLHFTRALVRRARGMDPAALADLDAALQADPAHHVARLHRGVARAAIGEPAAALEDFEKLQKEAPHQVEAHFNAGLALSRLGRHEQARACLQQARSLAPRSAPVLRALGNAVRQCGDPRAAQAWLAQACALAPRDPLGHTDHGMALLAAGDANAALAAFDRALALDPRDQTALAGLYLAGQEGADPQRARQLIDFTLVGRARFRYEAAPRLREAVLAHPQLRWEPSGKTTRHGEQTAFLDLVGDPLFAGFAAKIATCAQAHIDRLCGDAAFAGHPWLRGRPRRWRLQMWATVLHADGHQAPHIHPAGWMSGVYYLDDGDARPGEGGTIHFGRGPDDLRLRAPPPGLSHQPATGDLLLFPSYFHHDTEPFRGAGTRISLAFDLLPA